MKLRIELYTFQTRPIRMERSQPDSMILYVLHELENCFELRIQNILYFIDLNVAEFQAKRDAQRGSKSGFQSATGVSFIRVLKGAYSEEIKDSLDELHEKGVVKIEKRVIERRQVDIYQYQGEECVDLPNLEDSSDEESSETADIEKKINEVLDHHGDISHNKLVKRVKRSKLYEDTNMNDRIDFQTYYDSLYDRYAKSGVP